MVKDSLLTLEEDGLRAFMASEGGQTIFRRQNAMGENWQEECRNGTMSLLSEMLCFSGLSALQFFWCDGFFPLKKTKSNL